MPELKIAGGCMYMDHFNGLQKELIDKLNDADAAVRLDSLRRLRAVSGEANTSGTEASRDVNNHIHTWYSFSPYSPSKAVWAASSAGLTTAGLMDHDSISGAGEFIEAGKIYGIATTIGVECRADFSATSLKGRRINNPDQPSIAYIALHGIPHTEINTISDYFKPFRLERNKRNRKMTERINTLLKPYSIGLDFERDIVPLSKASEGGSITERHLLYGLSIKLVERFGKGPAVVCFLKEKLKINLSPKIEDYLSDSSNEFYLYDLLGALKSEMVEQFYIDAGDECPAIRDLLALSREIGAIAAYAYLGDVGDSVTGDKKAQRFEDSYIEELFAVLAELGFNAVTYMPSRNSLEQLRKIRELCDGYGFFQISGEDINSPRQPFVCKALRNPEFQNLYRSARALIGHERAATEDKASGMFSSSMIEGIPGLDNRVEYFMNKALQSTGGKI